MMLQKEKQTKYIQHCINSVSKIVDKTASIFLNILHFVTSKSFVVIGL